MKLICNNCDEVPCALVDSSSISDGIFRYTFMHQDGKALVRADIENELWARTFTIDQIRSKEKATLYEILNEDIPLFCPECDEEVSLEK